MAVVLCRLWAKWFKYAFDFVSDQARRGIDEVMHFYALD